MLKKEYRLKTDEEFARVFRNGKPLFFGGIGCKIAENSLNHLRLGFSFSKKHLPLAVDRNRLRRVLAAVCASPEWADIRGQGVDIVFFSLKKGIKMDQSAYSSITEELKKRLSR